MRGIIGSSQMSEQHVSGGLASVIYEASQPQPSVCSRDAGGVSLLKMLFHSLLDLRLSECIKELHLDRESAIPWVCYCGPRSPSRRCVPLKNQPNSTSSSPFKNTQINNVCLHSSRCSTHHTHAHREIIKSDYLFIFVMCL